MRLPNPFAKDIFIRLDGEAFTSTVKYGRFHSKTEEFRLDSEAPARTWQESLGPAETDPAPPPILPPKNLGA